MIAHLKGILQSKTTDQIIVDVNGVGYQVFVSLNTFYELPPEAMEVSLYIHTHLREDQLRLFAEPKIKYGKSKTKKAVRHRTKPRKKKST